MVTLLWEPSSNLSLREWSCMRIWAPTALRLTGWKTPSTRVATPRSHWKMSTHGMRICLQDCLPTSVMTSPSGKQHNSFKSSIPITNKNAETSNEWCIRRLTKQNIGGPSGYAPVAGVCDAKRSCSLNRDEGLSRYNWRYYMSVLTPVNYLVIVSNMFHHIVHSLLLMSWATYLECLTMAMR